MPSTTHNRRVPTGATVLELLVVTSTITMLLAITLPVVARARGFSFIDVSLGNLYTLGTAQAIYAMDWNGRQVTFIDDDISAYGDNPREAFRAYAGGQDAPPEDWHPPAVLGWGYSASAREWRLYAYRMSPGSSQNATFVEPIRFSDSLRYFGAFRLNNTRTLHDYVNGRFYDRVFYPPADDVVYDIVEPAFAVPDEYVPGLHGIAQELGGIPAWPGYCLSPAALFHPDVMRTPSAGGWQDPWLIDHGFTTPGLYQARFPSLKTMFLEHHWNQNPPDPPCNPAFDPGTFADCEPYYFNASRTSAPSTLFYDLSVRVLPNVEPLAADQRLLEQSGEGLWSRDTPFGANGYLIDHGFDGAPISHHILTTDGILGRDTIPALDTALTIYGETAP